jgi:hypothetical protein
MLMNLSSKLIFLESFLGKSRYSHNTHEALVYCPYCHHHKPKLSINLETDKWRCFPCGKGGYHLYDIVKRFGSTGDVKKYLEYYKAKQAKVKNKPIGFSVSLPQDYTALVNCKNSTLGRIAWKYLTEKRGIEEEDILFYKIGVTKDGVLLPSFDSSGYLNLYTVRNFTKGYFSPEVPQGYKNTIILNELNINWKKPVTIVEGFFDLLKTTGNTVPLFGSSLIKDSKLFAEIVANKTTVILGLDPDARPKAIKIAQMFMRYDIKVYDINITPFKDIGEMSKKEFKERYDNAKLITRKDIFKERLNSL